MLVYDVYVCVGGGGGERKDGLETVEMYARARCCRKEAKESNDLS